MWDTICIFYAAEKAPITKSFSKSPKMPKILDRGNSRAYYFSRRTAEKRLFTRLKVSYI